ncbi:hypothetical protein D3C71_1761570 [compost metagenome]
MAFFRFFGLGLGIWLLFIGRLLVVVLNQAFKHNLQGLLLCLLHDVSASSRGGYP